MPLFMEELEPRCLLSIAAPSATEQYFLELLNEARANPAAYGASIGVDLSGVAPSQPLAFDPRLIASAQEHSLDMSVQGYFDHNTPQGETPGQRITAAGFNWQSYGESIAGSPGLDPAGALSALIADEGVPDLGHRIQLLAMTGMFQSENAVGIGILENSSGPLGNYYTIDTANAVTTLPYITGVVMNDANGNGQYDIGEGLGNVTIAIAGVGSVTTWDSGGYSYQLAPGTYTVTASGGSLAAPITQVVTVGSQNLSLNFTVPPPIVVNALFVPKIYQTDLGRKPSARRGLLGLPDPVRGVVCRDCQRHRQFTGSLQPGDHRLVSKLSSPHTGGERNRLVVRPTQQRSARNCRGRRYPRVFRVHESFARARDGQRQRIASVHSERLHAGARSFCRHL